ncbi:hypothetical protein L9F63_021759, partial [Diploptera punctata]
QRTYTLARRSRVPCSSDLDGDLRKMFNIREMLIFNSTTSTGQSRFLTICPAMQDKRENGKGIDMVGCSLKFIISTNITRAAHAPFVFAARICVQKSYGEMKLISWITDM